MRSAVAPRPRSSRLTRYDAAVYFPGSSANQVKTADANPITFGSGEPYTLALLIRWTRISGTQGIFRSGSASSGNWLWMSSSGRLWGRHANVDSPGSRSGPTHRGMVHSGPCLGRTAGAAVHGWPAHQHGRRDPHRQLEHLKRGWQFSGSQVLDEAYVPSSARSARPGTKPWSPAGAPIHSACSGRRWMWRSEPPAAATAVAGGDASGGITVAGG